MKINIDLDQPIKDLNGKPIGPVDAKGNPIGEPHKLSTLLVETLLNGNEGPPLKLLSISEDLKENGKVSLTVDDYNLVMSLIEKDKRLTNLGKARILEAMEAGRIKAIPNPD